MRNAPELWERGWAGLGWRGKVPGVSRGGGASPSRLPGMFFSSQVFGHEPHPET